MIGAAPRDRRARDRVLAARVVAQRRWPYTAALLFTLRLVEADPDEVPTMAVDEGWRLYYGAPFVLSLPVDTLASVVLHEAQHLLLRHAQRFRATGSPAHHHVLWNYAADANINATLEGSGQPLPASLVRYADLAHAGVQVGDPTEVAFHKLLDAADDPPRSGSDSPASGVPQTRAQGSVTGADCGSGSDGQPRSYELAPEDSSAPAVPEAQRQLVGHRVAIDISRHAHTGSDIPDALLDWAQDVLHPRIDWRRQLAGQVRAGMASTVGRRDFSYTRPSRRGAALAPYLGGVVLPALRQPPPPRVIAITDTSPSITQEEHLAFLAELSGIARAVGSPGVTVIPCAERAFPSMRVRHPREVPSILPLPGGSGTDMGLGLQAAADLPVGQRAPVVVVLTDGYTQWPDRPNQPRATHIVVLTSEHAPTRGFPTPSWAATVVMRLDDPPE